MTEEFDTYLDKHKIVKAEDLPDNENIYLKKDFMGWRLVNPIKNPDMTTNWKALLIGNWRNLITYIVILLIITMTIGAYSHDINKVKELSKGCLDNPVAYCKSYILPFGSPINKDLLDEGMELAGDNYGKSNMISGGEDGN